MKNTLKRLSLILLLIYLASAILLYTKQRDLLYHTTPSLPTTYATLIIENDGEKVRVLVLNKGQEKAIIYFAGNGESIVNSADTIAKRFSNSTVYRMEYRGYGKSTGEPTEAGIYADALKLYDTVKVSHQEVIIAGRSLGSAVATYVASQREVSKLALITPFDSIANIAKEQYPIYPIALLLKDTYDSKSRVSKIGAKTLIIVAQNDNIVSKARSDALIKAFDSSQIQVKMIKNRGHINLTSDEKYIKIIQVFMEKK